MEANELTLDSSAMILSNHIPRLPARLSPTKLREFSQKSFNHTSNPFPPNIHAPYRPLILPTPHNRPWHHNHHRHSTSHHEPPLPLRRRQRRQQHQSASMERPRRRTTTSQDGGADEERARKLHLQDRHGGDYGIWHGWVVWPVHVLHAI